MTDLHIRGGSHVVLKLIRATDHCCAITHPSLSGGDSQEKNHALQLTVCPGEDTPFCRVKYVYQLLNHSHSVGAACIPFVEKQWVAPHIDDTKTHAIQTLGVSIPQFKSRESCTPLLLKQLIQTPVKDGARQISLRHQGVDS